MDFLMLCNSMAQLVAASLYPETASAALSGAGLTEMPGGALLAAAAVTAAATGIF
jgi:hypothetical protein